MSATCKTVAEPVRRIGRSILIGLIAGSVVTSAHAEIARSVLILDQSFPGRSAYAEIEEAFRETLGVGSAAVYAEKLDLNHFGGPEHRRLLETYIRGKYHNTPIGVIVAFGERALLCAISLRDDQRFAVPIVFGAVARQATERLTLPENVTGRTLDISLANFVSAARILVPGLKRVALVGDPLERQTFRRHFKQEVASVASALELIDLTGSSMNVLKHRLASLPSDSAILFTSLNIDGDGEYFRPRDALKLLVAVANRPIVVDVGTHLGTGVAGGMALMPVPVGQETAQLVARIFRGEDASQIPVASSDAMKQVFDWRALQRWNIGEAQLPPGSDILFRQTSTWERYRWQVALISLAFILQTALIAALLYEDRARRTAQSQSFQMMTELARRDRIDTAGELSASIAHEVRQPLAAIVAYGTAGKRWLSNKVPDLDEARRALQKVVDEAHRAGDVIKSVCGMFSHTVGSKQPINIDSLIQKVLELAAIEIKKRRVKLTLDIGGDKSPLAVQGSEVQLQQVVLNVVFNAIEAMSTTTGRDRLLHVASAAKDGDVLISVADSGPGIDPNNLDKIFNPFFTTKVHGMGLGLSICKSIVEAHGGRMTAANGVVRGLVVEIAIPQLERS